MTLTSCIKMVYKTESSHVSVSQSLNSSSIKTGHRILERIYVQLNQRRPGRVSVLSFVFWKTLFLVQYCFLLCIPFLP